MRLPNESSPRAANTEAAESEAGRPDEHEDTTSIRHTLEAALVGAMILSPEARTGALDRIAVDDLDREGHRVVFAAIRDLHRANHPVDQVTVNDQLDATGTLDTAGSLASVWELTAIEGCPNPAAWRYYLGRVLAASRRADTLRRLRRAVRRIEAGEDPNEVTAELETAA